jgi:hypothetical protein
MPAIFQTSYSNEVILWFMLYLLFGVWIVSMIDKATGFLNEFDQFNDNKRAERTEVWISSREHKRVGGKSRYAGFSPQESPKLILRSPKESTKIQDFDCTASHGR